MNVIRIFIPFLFTASSLVAQRYTVSGYVVDKKTGETLIGVNIIVRGEYRGAATDGNGYFRITGFSSGRYVLVVSHIGYGEKEVGVTIREESIVLDDIPLEPEVVELEGIVVKGQRSEIGDIDVESSHREMAPRAIHKIPTASQDVFKALQYLPGVEGIDPFSPLYAVRGGEPGENLILLDGVTIYNPYHCVTSTSLFNLYAIKNVEMLVGGFGAEYGGRNSSVLYITTREGNNQELHGEIEATTSHTKMVLDFPVGKNATMMVSGRIYYNLWSRFLFYSPSYLYDMNVSFNWKLNSKNRLSLRYFFSRDFMDISMARFMSYFANTFDLDVLEDYDVVYKNRWNNTAATAILKTIVSPKIYLKTQISGSFFSSSNLSMLDFEYFDEDENTNYKLFYRTDIRNKIRDLSGEFILSAKWNSANTIALGGEFSHYFFSNDIRINDFSEGKTTRKPWLIAGFLEDKLTLGSLSFRIGMRLSKFRFAKRWYHEMRLNGVYRLPFDVKFRAAWGQYHQYIISINSQEYEISQLLDYYYPLKGREPSTSTHTVFGLEKSITENSQLSIDVYHKDISRVYTFDYNISELEAYRFSDKLEAGWGKSYGVELLWKGTWKRLSGWLSYGLSRATRSYAHIMDGKTFLFDYDRMHSFKAMINHQIHPALSYSGTLRIMSGVPKTLETSVKSYFYYDPATNEHSSFPTYVANRKNNARLPLYIRLDVGLKKRIRKGFGAELAEFLGAKESYLNVSFGNLLFLYRNVMLYLPVGEEKLYGFGSNYIPEFSVGYTIKF